MAGMQRVLRLAFVIVIACGILMPVVAAQQSPHQPAAKQPPPKPAPEPSNPYDDTQPYTSPAPWKSVEIGNYYFRKKNVRAALSRYKEAVQTDPHYAPGYLGLGKVYERMGLRKKALESYQRYLDELPSEKEALEAKGVRKAITKLERELKLPASQPPQSAPAATAAQAH